MHHRSRRILLTLGAIVFFLQATLGFATSVACIQECAQAARAATSSAGHCGHKVPESEGKSSAHQCNGSCQEMDTMDQATPPTAAISVTWPVFDWPATMPDSLDLRLPLSIGVLKIFAGDSSPPQSAALKIESARAPPVA